MIILSFLFITLYGQALYSSYNVFLTEGETYSLPMKELFQKNVQNFTIQDCPDNVQLFQTLNILSEQNNNLTFISISSTPPFFLLITQVNTLNIYIWNTTYLNLINQVELPQQTCLNSILFQENSILIDCYNLTNLNMYIYQENAWVNVYSRLIQQIPKKTDLKLFTSNSINSILYAQYYDQYQILTQFQFGQNILYNMSTYTKLFINFIVSNQLQYQNTIYLWNNNYIYILNITQQGFNLTGALSYSYQIMAVQIFNPQLVVYQCDIIQIIGVGYNDKLTICNQTLISSQFSISSTNCNNNYQVFLSNQFLILQLFELIEIYEIIDVNFNLIGVLKLNSSFTQVSYDYNSNELFIFCDTQILTYLINYPHIKFNSQQDQPNYELILIGSPFQQNNDYECQNCQVQLNVNVLPINDNETYIIYKNMIRNQNVYIFDSQNYIQLITQYSGSLLTANFSVKNSNLGNFNDITFQEIGIQDQSFLNFQFLNLDYAVGITNQNISLLHLKNDQNGHLYSQIIFSNGINSQIIIKQNQIQGYNVALKDIPIYGVQINRQQLYLCTYENSNNQTQSILTFQPFQQFYLLFQQIVLLLESNTIQICSFTGNCTNLKINTTNNQSVIPVGIVFNQQLFSSILFINNNYSSIVIGQITDQNSYIIMSINNVGIQVQDMKVVNSRLILSYSCQITSLICFQVWNVENLNSPFLEKNLKSIQNSNNIQFFADNLFYYVQTNNQMYVYNPSKLEHSSLFYTFNYNVSYFATTSSNLALMSFNSSFYVLSPVLTFSYHTAIKNTISNEISIWSNNYNFSVSSQFGSQGFIQYPLNQIIYILNDFANIQLINQTYNIQKRSVILNANNITFSGQIGWFSISSNCNVTNILTETNLTLKCGVFTVFNQQILCNQNQNLANTQEQYLQLYTMTPEGKLIQGSNQLKYPCQNSNAQMNTNYIFIICYQPNSQSYYGYDLFRINITNQSLGNMTYLTRFNTYISQLILQDDILYIYNNQLITIYQTTLNITQSISTLCYLRSFQPFVFQYQNYSFYAIIYVCQDDQNLYYQLGKRYQKEQISFIQPKHLQIQKNFYFESLIVGILILSQKQNKFAIMCFINSFSIIVQLEYIINEKDFTKSILQLNTLLQYSAPLFANNSYQFVDAQISNDLVVVGYFRSYMSPRYIIYNFSSFQINEKILDQPIQLSGETELASNYYVDSLQYLVSPPILTFNSSYGYILSFPIYKIDSFQISIYHLNLSNQCQLSAYNYLNQKIANYTFNFQSQTDFGFEYAFLAFFIIVIIAATTLIWYRTRDQKEQFGLEEFEGFEIDTFQ